MRPAPLPPRDGLGPARLRVRGGPLAEELNTRFGPEVAAKAIAGEVVDQHGAVLDPTNPANADAINDNIRKSFHAFDDENQDGVDDHEEGAGGH